MITRSRHGRPRRMDRELRTESILRPWGRWAGRSPSRRGQRLFGTPRRDVIALDVRGVWPAH
jgi:hypothetical protein